MTILQGVMLIPPNSYQGSGEAIIFVQKDKNPDGYFICDKILYYKNVKDAELDGEGYMVSVPVEFAIESDDQHNTLRAMISSWQAILPDLGIHYELKEK